MELSREGRVREMNASAGNPYRPPDSLPRESEQLGTIENGRKHHLSNRFMSVLMGGVGSVFLVAGTLWLVGAILHFSSVPSRDLIWFLCISAMFGVGVLLLGLFLVVGSYRLARFDSVGESSRGEGEETRD